MSDEPKKILFDVSDDFAQGCYVVAVILAVGFTWGCWFIGDGLRDAAEQLKFGVQCHGQKCDQNQRTGVQRVVDP